jgi:hypothetical protein
MEEHQAAVDTISERVKSFYQAKTPFRLYHGSTNSTRQYKVDKTRMVDTSKLNHVLKVDKAAKTCLVEPNVPMDQLVDAVMPFGLLPPVVMEFPGITVGGGFAGTAGESSGFKYGFFDSTVNWIEIVQANGEVVKASRTEYSDLFHAAAGTMGTLGVTTLLEISLIDAQPYVEMTYHPTSTIEEATTTMAAATKDHTNDYIDGITFSRTRSVIITGRLTSAQPTAQIPLQPFSRAVDPWFYIHVDRSTRSSLDPVKFLTPTRDYLFRYDRGAFWTGKYAYQYFLTPFNRITRWALDYFMHTRVMYHALHASGHASKYIVQDLLLPNEGVEPFIEFCQQRFGFYPLWLCPLKRGQEVAMRPRLISGEKTDSKDPPSFVNIGVWGPGPTNYADFVRVNRELEHKVRSLGGIKWLYAQGYYTQDEFWDIYDRKWYEAIREKYHATYLPTVYEKVNVDLSVLERQKGWGEWARGVVWDTWPFSGVYGVLKTLVESDYLLKK